MPKLGLVGVLFAALAFSTPVAAADIPPQVQVRLQSAMQQYIDQISVDGAYSYIDSETSELKTVYPANVHPMVLSFGDDYFVCSELVDENGSNLTADFLVRQFGDGYRVVQMIIDNRRLVEQAMSKVGR